MLNEIRVFGNELGPALVAVPVKDEAERIADCLRALALQHDVRADGIVLVVNNTSDGTAEIIRRLLPLLPVPVHVLERDFPPGQASAGHARRLAMEHAAALLGDRGVLLSTDADGRVPQDWVAANLWHLRRGLDAVAGRADLDPHEAALIPARLHEDDAEECAYAALLDETAALLDPDPWDPWPRHVQHSGASMAVSLTAYRRAGGMPAVPLAEDRRFFAALRRTDARIRHAPEITVTVSGRTAGRAEGGMADTIHRRLSAPDPYLDSALEPAAGNARRAQLRRRFRHLFQSPHDPAVMHALSQDIGLPVAMVEQARYGRYFGEAWAYLEEASPALVRRQVSASGLPGEMRTATSFLRSARARALTDVL